MKKVAFITDLHLLEKNTEKKGVNTLQNWKTVLQDVKHREIQHIILGGDLAAKEALHIIFEDVRDFDVQVIPGNHDHLDDIAEYYPNAREQKQLFYTRKYGHFTGIFLDTSSYKLNKKQQKFLTEQLALAENPVVIIHHPVLSIGSWMDSKHPLKNREEVLQILKSSAKETTVICGHYHQHHSAVEGSVKQIIAPAVSYQIPFGKDYKSDTSSFGYLILNFDGDVLQYEPVIFKN